MNALRPLLAAIGTVALASASLTLVSAPASALTDDITGLQYERNPDHTATITGCAGWCSDLSIDIPAQVHHAAETFDVVAIADHAFESELITSVTLPEGLRSIGDRAFADGYLGPVEFPSTLEHVGSYAFRWAQLGDVTLPASLTSLAPDAFRYSGIHSLTWEGPPTANPEGAFAGNDITSLTLPASVTTVGDYAFSGNDDLENVTLPAGLVSLGEGAFGAAYALTTLTYPGAPAGLALPPGLTSIGDWAFEQSGLAGHLELPAGLTSLGMGAFDSSYLTAVTLPDGIATIPNSAFGSNRITSLTIPASVTQIDAFAFEGNPLETVTFLGDQPAMGAQALATYDPYNQAYSLATVVYDVANSGFGHPEWAPYPSFAWLADLAHPTAPVATVVFDAAGHPDTPPSQTVALGGTLADPGALSLEGRDFLGWTSDAAGEHPWDFATDTVDAALTLHAQFQTTSHPVVFEFGHGLGSVSIEVEHGQAPVAPLERFLPGHRFDGWLAGSAAADLTAPITAPATFTASFAPSVYTLTGPASTVAGGEISVDGTGFDPGETVSLALHSEPVALGTVAADAVGAFSTTVTIPANTVAGDHTVVATGAAGTASAPLAVTAPPSEGGDEPAGSDGGAEADAAPEVINGAQLAATGTPDHLTLITLAATALALTGTALNVVRRRSAQG